jgi:hypothetical protein
MSEKLIDTVLIKIQIPTPDHYKIQTNFRSGQINEIAQ